MHGFGFASVGPVPDPRTVLNHDWIWNQNRNCGCKLTSKTADFLKLSSFNFVREMKTFSTCKPHVIFSCEITKMLWILCRFSSLDKQEKGYLTREDFLRIPELAINPLGDRIVHSFFTKSQVENNVGIVLLVSEKKIVKITYWTLCVC